MIEDAFVYQHFQLNPGRTSAGFHYRLNHDSTSYDFIETLEFPLSLPDTSAITCGLRALHLALGISYYKTFLPPTIKHLYRMTAEEASFWNDVWRGGLSEFLYVNKLPVQHLAKFTAQDGTKTTPMQQSAITSNRALLGVGGGKDSIVARELLRDTGVTVEGFVLATGEHLGQTKAVAQVMDIPLHSVKRTIDKQLLSVQELPGAYKGHIPISLIFGLVGTVLAAATDSKYVIVANEASASIPQTNWGEMAVNHQWSKSLEFEKKLQDYISTSVDTGVTYFSAIRQLTSVAVAKLFSRYSQYFTVFTSDNSVFRINPEQRPIGRWGLDSPKSLSSFILLAPWISEADLIRVFGLNFLDQLSLEKLFLELTGAEGHPPLDCVGTVEEQVLSLNLLSQQGKFKDSSLLVVGQKHSVITDKDWQPELAKMLSLQTDQALPTSLSDKITNRLREELTV